MSKINDIRTELWRLVNCPYEIRRVHTKIKELLQELDQYIEESFDIEEDVDENNVNNISPIYVKAVIDQQIREYQKEKDETYHPIDIICLEERIAALHELRNKFL